MIEENLLEKALNFDLTEVTERYAKEQNIPESLAKEHEIETKKYLLLCGVTNKEYGMRGPIDNYWHEFIVFTLPYFRYCNMVAGDYIHHVPNTTKRNRYKYSLQGKEDQSELPSVEDGNELKTERPIIEKYLDFLKDYEIYFGAKPSPHLWPLANKDEQNYASNLHCSGNCHNGCGRCGCRCHA